MWLHCEPANTRRFLFTSSLNNAAKFHSEPCISSISSTLCITTSKVENYELNFTTVLPDENSENLHIFKKKNPHKSARLQYGHQMQDIFKQNAKMKFIFTIGDSLFHFYS